MLPWSTVRRGKHTATIHDIASHEVRVGVHGVGGKDATRCQRGITSHCEVRLSRSSAECGSAVKMNKQGGLFQGPMCDV